MARSKRPPDELAVVRAGREMFGHLYLVDTPMWMSEGLAAQMRSEGVVRRPTEDERIAAGGK